MVKVLFQTVLHPQEESVILISFLCNTADARRNRRRIRPLFPRQREINLPFRRRRRPETDRAATRRRHRQRREYRGHETAPGAGVVQRFQRRGSKCYKGVGRGVWTASDPGEFGVPAFEWDWTVS